MTQDALQNYSSSNNGAVSTTNKEVIFTANNFLSMGQSSSIDHQEENSEILDQKLNSELLQPWIYS